MHHGRRWSSSLSISLHLMGNDGWFGAEIDTGSGCLVMIRASVLTIGLCNFFQ